jgi:hypothetical protein
MSFWPVSFSKNASWRFRLIVFSVVGMIFLAFNPWMIKEMIDGYVGYSGRVVNKGSFIWPLGIGDGGVNSGGFHYYMIIEDTNGQRQKRYLNFFEYFKCSVGVIATKDKGFYRPVTFAGQMSPKELDELANKAGVDLPSHPPWIWFIALGAVFLVFRWIFKWARSDSTTN